MGSINSQMNQIFLSHYGIGLNPPQGNPREPAAGSKPAADPNDGQPRLEAQGQQPPRSAQTELSRLMLNLSRETFSTTAVDKLLSSKDATGILKKSDRKALQKLAKNATKALDAIKNYTVKDILNAANKATANKIAKKIAEKFEKAADLQLQLGNELRELASSPKYAKDEFASFRMMLDDVSFKCDSRGSEILTLYSEVMAFGEAYKNEVGDNPAFRQAKVDDLIRGMAGSMHGNDKSLLFKGKVDSIEARLAQLSTATSVSADDLKALLAEASELSAELKKPSVAQTMDADIHKALTTHLDTLLQQLSDRVDQAVEASVDGFTDQFGKMNQLGKNILEFVRNKPDYPVLGRLMPILAEIEVKGYRIDDDKLEQLNHYLNSFNSDRLQNDIDKFCGEIGVALRKPNETKGETPATCFLKQIGFNKFITNFFEMAKATVSELRNRRKSWGNAGGTAKLAGEDVVNAFRRNDKLSMLLEARVNGSNESALDPRLCDRNLVRKEKLGSGNANTVYKMTYKMDDGSTKDFVFKPDLTGRFGLKLLAPASFSYSDAQQSVKLNIATCDVADFLGLGRMTGRNCATVHDGQYGLLMEMAPGKTAESIAQDKSPENVARFANAQVVGSLARELNDLRWLDIATGQGDRHDKNYLVDFGPNGLTPKVTAIDNDVSFTPYLVGVGKYKINHDFRRLDSFKKQLEYSCMISAMAGFKTDGKKVITPEENEAIKKIATDQVDKILEKLKNDKFVLDVNKASKEEIYALRLSFHCHSFCQPQQMSRSLCTKLMSLTDAQIDEFAEKLGKNVDMRRSVNATVLRLKDLRQIAIDYEKNGKVVEDDKWGDKNVLHEELECPDLLKNQDRNAEGLNSTVNYQMSSTLSRDFGSIISNGLN